MTPSLDCNAMPILVNDQPCDVSRSSTLISLLQDLHMKESQALAVAVNGVFVRRADWQTQSLSSNDQVFVVNLGAD